MTKYRLLCPMTLEPIAPLCWLRACLLRHRSITCSLSQYHVYGVSICSIVWFRAVLLCFLMWPIGCLAVLYVLLCFLTYSHVVPAFSVKFSLYVVHETASAHLYCKKFFKPELESRWVEIEKNKDSVLVLKHFASHFTTACRLRSLH